jgi:DNA-binding CsgD family transcriptional regulator
LFLSQAGPFERSGLAKQQQEFSAMFDPAFLSPPHAANRARAVPPAASLPAPPHWFALMLDEIDYGMLLVADDRTVLHANHVARAELDGEHPLQLLGAELRVKQAQDLMPLREALTAARGKGLRRLLRLGEGAQQVSVAVVPLPAGEGEEPLALLVFGKRRVCEALSTHWFAREHGLTQAEARVLGALCEGHQPLHIAQVQGVAISTVRTQISAIRAKTGAESIRALVRQVAVLPPLVSALRTAVQH